MSDIARLCEVFQSLAPDARTVLSRIAERLYAGQQQYGILDVVSDPREWLEERQQEAVDMLVYGEFYAMRAERGEA